MSRNVVVCSDGTGNTFDSRVTNVTRLVNCLVLDSPARQLVLYDQGVGTAARRVEETRGSSDAIGLRVLPAPIAGTVRPATWMSRGRGLLFGFGLKENIRQMYRVLALNLDDADRLFLFGFSRGAFTVRALAGLLHRCHLPYRDSPDIDERFERSWSLFQPMMGDRDAIEALRREHRPYPVHFLGLWDTVKSYGGLKPIILPHLRHNPDVSHVRHALALDERRAWFKATTWGQLDSDRAFAMTRLDPAAREAYESQDIGEVWFTGCHSDVGGGDEDDTTSRISLRWMIGEAVNVAPPLLLNDAGAALLRDVDPPGPPTVRGSWNWPWRLAEHIPRLEIDNSDYYPVTMRHWGSDGTRDPDRSRRAGTVTVHSSVGDRPTLRGRVATCETKPMPHAGSP